MTTDPSDDITIVTAAPSTTPRPPAEWFTAGPDGWDPMTNGDDPVIWIGEPDPTFGGRRRTAMLVAPRGVCLLAGDRFAGECWTAPYSASAYAFASGGKKTQTVDGQTVATSNISMDLPHATGNERSAATRRAAFDDTSKLLAHVAYVDEPDAIYAFGVIALGVDDTKVERARSCALSGEWFPPDPSMQLTAEFGADHLEFVGSIVVAEQGFRRVAARTSAVTLDNGARILSPDSETPNTEVPVMSDCSCKNTHAPAVAAATDDAPSAEDRLIETVIAQLAARSAAVDDDPRFAAFEMRVGQLERDVAELSAAFAADIAAPDHMDGQDAATVAAAVTVVAGEMVDDFGRVWRLVDEPKIAAVDPEDDEPEAEVEGSDDPATADA